jgi:hypothetical protein
VVRFGELIVILELHQQGLSVSAIARHTGLSRGTIRKYVTRGIEPPAYGPRPPLQQGARQSLPSGSRSQAAPQPPAGSADHRRGHGRQVLVDRLGPDGHRHQGNCVCGYRPQGGWPSSVSSLFLDWTRRLVRTAWRCKQTSSAYVLTVPSTMRNSLRRGG